MFDLQDALAAVERGEFTEMQPLGDSRRRVASCVHCQFGLQPVRLRRRWVHHFADTGTIVVCEDRILKCE